MTGTSGSAIATYGEGVKWLVGLSATAVAGVFLHLKEIEGEAFLFRLLIWGAIVLFFISIWSGINYLLWLNAVGADQERIKEARQELQEATTEKEKADLEARIDKSKARIGVSEGTMPSWHRLYTYTFAGALLISTLSVSLALLVGHASTSTVHEQNSSGNKIDLPKTPASRYHLVYSAVHKTDHGKEAHTFLLDDQTGSLWQMVCAGKNEVVFRQVRRTVANNTPK